MITAYRRVTGAFRRDAADDSERVAKTEGDIKEIVELIKRGEHSATSRIVPTRSPS